MGLLTGQWEVLFCFVRISIQDLVENRNAYQGHRGLGVGVSSSEEGVFWKRGQSSLLARTLEGAYSARGRSRHLLETAFSEPLLRTLLRTLFYCKTHSRPPSQNPSENPFPRTLPRTFSEPFLERCVAVRPLRRAPKLSRDSREFRDSVVSREPQDSGKQRRIRPF